MSIQLTLSQSTEEKTTFTDTNAANGYSELGNLLLPAQRAQDTRTPLTGVCDHCDALAFREKKRGLTELYKTLVDKC